MGSMVFIKGDLISVLSNMVLAFTRILLLLNISRQITLDEKILSSFFPFDIIVAIIRGLFINNVDV